MAQNAADIEAMGGRATAFVVGFGAPPDTPTAQVDALADGMWDEAGRVGAGIVGRRPGQLPALGRVGDGARRSGRPRAGVAVRRPAGSRIAVAGQLGYSAAGYALWHNGIDGFDDFGGAIWCRNRRTGRVAAAAEAGAQAMIDVSDGLVGRPAPRGRCVRRGHRPEHRRRWPPIASACCGAAEVVGVDPWTWVLGGGEDHALVAAFRRSGARRVARDRAGARRAGAGACRRRPWRGYAGWQSFGR